MTLETDAATSTDTRFYRVDGGTVDGTFPAVRIYLAFDIGAYDERIAYADGIWTEITDHVHAPSGVTVTRGRSDEFDDPQPGECTFVIRDFDRTFDPINDASPYAHKLRPRLPVRITATWANTEYPVFTGYVEGFPQRYDVADRVTWIEIHAHDLLTVLGSQRFLPARPFILDDPDFGLLDSYARLSGIDPLLPSERSGTRVASLLLTAGLGGALVDADPGQTVLMESTPKADNMVSHLIAVARTENGRLFVKPNGTLRFQERTYPAATYAGLFLDQPGWGLAYQTLELDVAAYQDIRNEVTRSNGVFAAVTAKDAASVDLYGTISDQQTDLLFESVVDAQDQAAYLLGRYSTPTTRIRTMQIAPPRWPTILWPAVLDWDLGTRLVVGRTPHNIGAPITQAVTIERITHEFTNASWTTTYGLIAADTTDYFRLDDSNLGQLDAGKELAY